MKWVIKVTICKIVRELILWNSMSPINMQNCHFFFLLPGKFAGLLQTEPFYSCKFAPDNPIYHFAEEQCNLANFSLHWSDYFGKLWQIYSRWSEHSILKCKGFVLINLCFCLSSRAVSYNSFWKGLSKISDGFVSSTVGCLIFFLSYFPVSSIFSLDTLVQVTTF